MANRIYGEVEYRDPITFAKGVGVWGTAPPVSQPVKIDDVTETADSTYDTTEVDMLNNLKDRVNKIIDVLEGAGLSSST